MILDWVNKDSELGAQAKGTIGSTLECEGALYLGNPSEPQGSLAGEDKF